MEIKIDSIQEFLNKNAIIPKRKYINIPVEKPSTSFNIILQNAKCEMFKGAYTYVSEVVEVFIKGAGIISNHRVLIPYSMLGYYLTLIDVCIDDRDILNIYLLMKNQLKIGDTILFDSGRKGRILSFTDSSDGQIYYKLVKKDGSLGVKNLILYGNSSYRIEDREIINFSYLNLS